MNQNPTVNVPKKSMSVKMKMIISICVFICCLCCVLMSGGSGGSGGSRGSGTRTRSTMSTDTSTGGANPESISTKPMVVQLYKTPDCSGEPTDAMTINQLGMPLDLSLIHISEPTRPY